jgi:integrase
MSGRRGFGNIRRLASGRYQVRYQAPDGSEQSAPETFDRKRDAELWLSNAQTEQARGTWIDPKAGAVLFREFATTWIAERQGLAETSRERYQAAFRLQLEPTLGDLALRDITEAVVRRWYKDLLDGGTGRPSVTKAYRVLRAILNTAVDDDLIRRNPCRIRGGGIDKPEERPVLDVPQVMHLAEVIEPRYRALILLATFTGLRFGELAALTRTDLDLRAGLVHVRRGQVELSNGTLLIRPPKSEAGKRTVNIPTAILPDLAEHLDTYSGPGADGRIFTMGGGGAMRRQNFGPLWIKTIRAAGLPPVHFHDLRHTGNTLAAATGASLRELMARMGHASPRAALIYQHASIKRDRVIADALSAAITVHREHESVPDVG